MKLHYWNENCLGAGQLVPSETAEEYTGPDGDSTADDHGDWSCLEGTAEEILEYAQSLEHGGCTPFQRRLAANIRERVYFEFPNLEPAEVE